MTFFISPGFNLLAAVLLPLLAAIGVRLFSRHPNIREGVTLLVAALTFIQTLGIYQLHQQGTELLVTNVDTLPGLSITFRTEPLGVLFALIASGLWVITSIYAIGYLRGNKEKDQSRFFACFAIAIACAMGISFADNLFTLFICYEAMTLSTYPLVTHSGNAAAQRGGRTYIGILMGTSLCLLLPAMLWVWHLTGTLTFTEGGILSAEAEPWQAVVLFAMFCFGIGKAALMPFHRWLPAAMVAPTPVSALLHAVAVVKAGVFSILKITVYTFGPNYLQYIDGTNVIIFMASVTILLGSLVAMRQDNLKRRLAYSTISQLSYIVLATAVLAPLSIMAAALHIAAHACGKITLFFAAGSIYTASKKTLVSQLDGIGKRMPLTMLAFTIGSLSMIGLPPTAGFISKWYMILGAVEADRMAVIMVIVLSTLLNAAYFLPIIHAAFFRKEATAYTDEKVRPEHQEAPWPMVLALLSTASLTLLLFLFPEPLLHLTSQLAEIR